METQRKGRNFLEWVDPRIKLYIMLLFGTMMFMAPNNFVLIWDYSVVFIFWMLSSKKKTAVTWTVIFFVFLYLNELLGYINNAWLEVGLGMVVFMIARVIAIFMVAGWVLMDLHIGDFVTAMQKMHLPKGFTMTLAVIFRYMPTIRIEFRNINNTMKMRDIEFNVKNIFKHPAKTIEYALVPLVLRSIKVADELSASAMTRGLDLERSRTSHRDVRLSSRDYLFAALVTLSLIASTVVNMLLQNGGF